MKKTITVLLMLALCLSLCACSAFQKVELPAVPTAAAETEEPAQTPAPVEQDRSRRPPRSRMSRTRPSTA